MSGSSCRVERSTDADGLLRAAAWASIGAASSTKPKMTDRMNNIECVWRAGEFWVIGE